ncbi:four-carbon acid sugar kinase family protein [Mesorhizobium sp. B2-4-12]|uniref:3-oxo-tetronate kinase n=1 Tax=Mesorhizobium sp. B2-4-12 TaxID=2589937 RepID=UPI00112A7CD3|nr:3-oxo-tetronate kinase [Mesorhizobium sp. B2-4-12]TPK93896.1 four-carbon acid sugar kinase family protein [Mesorhizobium sp. B2-4-12]
MLLGCIADDFTGATDLASMLVEEGIKTIQFIGVPTKAHLDAARGYDAVVVALKSRTTPVAEAVALSRQALDWLREAGAEQIFFKYCSTFDSTPDGNIGPVADMLATEIGASITVVSPALPANGRTVYKGHLFVGDQPLDESGMRDHPLTPMTDSSLIRLLAAQTPARVDLVDHGTVRQGRGAIRARLDAMADIGVRYAVIDVIVDADLVEIGAACTGLKFVSGGSGLGLGIARNLSSKGSGALRVSITGPAAVISGSCSLATNRQVALMQANGLPTYRIDPMALANDPDAVVSHFLDWAAPQLGDAPILVYATATPDKVRQVQQKLGVAASGQLVESTLARIAKELVERGVRRLIVAGGETSGAVVGALGIDALAIGATIAPGVPWTIADVNGSKVALALKSGNFGPVDFFLSAWEKLS